MENFSIIYERAAERKGGVKNLELLLPEKITEKHLASLSNRDYLSAMSKKIFSLVLCGEWLKINGQDIVDKAPSSQKDLKQTQAAFNQWQQQSGRSMAEISRIIAYSIGENTIN